MAITDNTVEVTWTNVPSEGSLTQHALRLLKSGKFTEAVPFLETIVVLDPDDGDTLYNLGMAESDLGAWIARSRICGARHRGGSWTRQCAYGPGGRVTATAPS